MKIVDIGGRGFQKFAAAIFANPYQRVWGTPGEPPAPRLRSLFSHRRWRSRVVWHPAPVSIETASARSIRALT